MTEKMKTETLIEKLVAVALAVRYITKGGENTAQKYRFVGEAQVVEKVGPALLEKGVLCYPQHKMIGTPIQFTTAKGSVQFLTSVETTWVFTDGISELQVVTIGQGTDAGDKGIYKAMTGAKKYGLLQALMIATGDDPEETRDDEKPERKTTARAANSKAADTSGEPATQGQKNRMFAMATEAGLDLSTQDGKNALTKLVALATGKYKKADLTQGDMEKVYASLTISAVENITGGEEVVAGATEVAA